VIRKSQPISGRYKGKSILSHCICLLCCPFQVNPFHDGEIKNPLLRGERCGAFPHQGVCYLPLCHKKSQRRGSESQRRGFESQRRGKKSRHRGFESQRRGKKSRHRVF